MSIRESVKKYTKKCFGGIVLFVCSFLLWNPLQAQAAEQTVANLVLMVDFEGDNRKFETMYKSCEEVYTTEPYNGVHAYIRAISDGKVEIKSFFPQDTGNSFVAITMPGSSRNYTKDQETTFVSDVIAKFNELVTSGAIPWINEPLNSGNNQNYIDNVTFLVQISGTGTEPPVAPDKSSPFYPHKQDCGTGSGKLFGKDMVVYNIVPSTSLWLDSDGKYMGGGYSTVAHELLHSLGAPDLYRTTGDAGEPVGIWDHMATTRIPANYPLVYTRKDLGWIPEEDIPTVTTSGTYKLTAAENSSGKRAYILKTPMSSSQFFVVEYREKRQASGADRPYDSNYLPESGLVVYRVNTAVSGHTNAEGNNYIYVFRPGTQDSKGAYESCEGAAVGTPKRPSLGSADMSDPCTADTIFYDDGTNSGIVIDNVHLDNGTATFDVKFPELSGDSYWLPQGEAVNGLQGPVITGSKDGTKLYMAGTKLDNYGNGQGAALYAWQDGTWQQLMTFGSGNKPVYDILYMDDVVYVAYMNASNSLSIGKYQNNGWTDIYTQSGYYPTNTTLISVNGEIWISSYDGDTLNIMKADGSSSLQPLKANTSIGNPSAFYYKGKWYAVYSNYFASGDAARGKIACYDTGSNTWKDVTTINSVDKVKIARSSVVGDVVYIVAGDNSGTFLTWDGTTLEEQPLQKPMTEFQLVVKDQIPYIIRKYDTVLRADYYKDGTWSELANTIASDANMFDTFCADGTMYVASSSTAGLTTVRKMKTIEGPPDPDPKPNPDPKPDPDPVQPGVGSGNVVLTLPAGYSSSAKLYIDGVEFGSTSWQNDESKRLVSIGSNGPLGKTAQTAAAYNYDASGIPRGMYVWSLAYDGDHYTATSIPEFENLFTYHGFSVRYTGNTGLRCTYGIDSTKKSQLISTSGLNGYRITEMGTLIMHPDNHVGNPMIYGSSKVSGGRTYWVANGKIYNKVIRKTNGRDQFANVLTKLPPKRYNTAYYFRAYAVMSHNGSDVVIYGPEMSRSMYTVCKQILNRGDFKPGSSGYRFLKNIVDTVENQ